MKGFTFGSKNNELLIYIGLILPVVGAILYIYIYIAYMLITYIDLITELYIHPKK